MEPTLVLLAAGLSTRYGRPKQLEPLGPGGEALPDYAAYDARRAGFSRVVLIIREELEEDFRRHLEGRWPESLEVVFHHQRMDDLPGGAEDSGGHEPTPGRPVSDLTVPEPPTPRMKPWGTAHALLTARSLLPEPFVVLNADDFYGASAYERAASLLNRGAHRNASDLPIFGLVGYTLEDTLSEHGGVSRGLCRVDSRGMLEEVVEVLEIRKDRGAVLGRAVSGEEMILVGNERVSTNFWVFTPDIFPLLEASFRTFLQDLDPEASAEPEFLIPMEVNRMLREGQVQVRVYPAKDPFFGITHPEDRGPVMEALARQAREGRYPESLWGEG